jgi:hypothetical protein
MSLTEKLQKIILSSEFLKRVQEIKNSIERVNAEYRNLTDAEYHFWKKTATVLKTGN